MVSPEDDLFRRLEGAEAAPPVPAGAIMMREMARGDLTPVTLGTIFTHHDTHPIVIDFSLLKAFGPEWVTWEPETIWQEIARVFNSKISETARAKVQSVKTLRVSDLPWEKWQVIEKVLQGLNNNIPRWEIMQAPSIEQMYAGIDIINQIREVEFSDEVKLYLAAAALNDEVCFVPPPLDFFQVELAQPMVECLDCGSRDSALFHDGVCDTCSGKFLPEQGLSMQPHPSREGRGRNTKIVTTYNPDPVRERWLPLEHAPLEGANLEENQVDVQVHKLLVARDYANMRRRQLADQLTNLKSWLGS